MPVTTMLLFVLGVAALVVCLAAAVSSWGGGAVWAKAASGAASAMTEALTNSAKDARVEDDDIFPPL